MKTYVPGTEEPELLAVNRESTDWMAGDISAELPAQKSTCILGPEKPPCTTATLPVPRPLCVAFRQKCDTRPRFFSRVA
jgi:hypothetical protein